jgi:hypothetical protein
MRPSFRTVLYLFPLALAAGALYQATRGDQAQLGIRQAPAQAQEWVARLEAELREHLKPRDAPPPAGGF